MKRLAQSILMICPSHTISNKILVSRLPAKTVNAYQRHPFHLPPFLFMLPPPPTQRGWWTRCVLHQLHAHHPVLQPEVRNDSKAGLTQSQQFAELVFIIYHRPRPTFNQALNSSIDLKAHAINFPPKEEVQAPSQPQFQNVPTD